MGSVRACVQKGDIERLKNIFKTVSLFDCVSKSSIPHNFLLLSEGHINLTRQAKLGPGAID